LLERSYGPGATFQPDLSEQPGKTVNQDLALPQNGQNGFPAAIHQRRLDQEPRIQVIDEKFCSRSRIHDGEFLGADVRFTAQIGQQRATPRLHGLIGHGSAVERLDTASLYCGFHAT
jgi:hypothetical protein